MSTGREFPQTPSMFITAVLAALRMAFREYVDSASCASCGEKRMAVSMQAEARLLDKARAAIEAYDAARAAEIQVLLEYYCREMINLSPRMPWPGLQYPRIEKCGVCGYEGKLARGVPGNVKCPNCGVEANT